jgi:serine/threonine-protein kinase
LTEQKKDGFYLEPYKSVHATENWFKNLKFLGKGGNGTAFLVMATDGPLRGGLFALKVFHMLSSERRQERFLEEVKFLKSSNHPNLMKQLDEGTYAGHPFVVQDYMPKTLHRELDGKSIEFGKALLFSCQLLSALQALHSQSFIHRDIKPQNIFVDNLTIYMGDFGLLKKIDTAHDEQDRNDFEGYFAMPKYYRTPELVAYAKRQGALDLRSDIFQLGLVIAQMFTGRNPLVYMEDSLSDIELENIGHVPGKHGGLVAKTIMEMTSLKPENRCSISTALGRFTGLVETYAKEYEAFHGVSFMG